MSLGRGGVVRNVKVDVTVVGLEGQVVVTSDCEHRLDGVNHRISYRNYLGEQLRFSLKMTLQEEGQIYEAHSTRDVVVRRGKTWRHEGVSRTGDAQPSQASAAIVSADSQMIVGLCALEYTVGFDGPRGASYTRKVDVPLT